MPESFYYTYYANLYYGYQCRANLTYMYACMVSKQLRVATGRHIKLFFLVQGPLFAACRLGYHDSYNERYVINITAGNPLIELSPENNTWNKSK